MMKYHLILSALLIVATNCFAQANVTVLYNELTKVISFDKQKLTNDFTRQEYLYTNGDSIGFFSFNMQKPDKKVHTVGSKKDHHALFVFPGLQRVLTENYWAKPYHLKEYPIATYEWKYHEDTMTVAGYLCHVAVADGLVAWYTKDIVSPFGPLDYHGLPGLILMLEDHRYNRLYKAVSVKQKAPRIELPGLEQKPCDSCDSKLEEIRSRINH